MIIELRDEILRREMEVNDVDPDLKDFVEECCAVMFSLRKEVFSQLAYHMKVDYEGMTIAQRKAITKTVFAALYRVCHDTKIQALLQAQDEQDE